MVFQSYALFPHMTVRGEHLVRPAHDRHAADGDRPPRRRGRRILQIEPLLERKPKQLSGGQRQRVAIGRAIVRKPKVFLFDEPLSNLDAALRVQMRLEIARLHAELGATMIYVTHDQIEAMTLADRIVVLNHGGVEQVGAPMELYEAPRNRFVAGFLGQPTMNFVDVSAASAAGRLALSLPRGATIELPGIAPGSPARSSSSDSARTRPRLRNWRAAISSVGSRSSNIWGRRASSMSPSMACRIS